MGWLLLLGEDTDERMALARVLKKKGFMIAEARDQTGARSFLASAAPVEMVIAGASCHDRGKLLSVLWEARPNIPVIFLAAAGSAGSTSVRITYNSVSAPQGLKSRIKTRLLAVEEIDRMIRIAAGKRRLASVPMAAA